MPRCFATACIVFLGGVAGSAAAQSTGLYSPVSGFLYSGTAHTVRPVLGIRGAARIGQPLLSELDFASVAPNGAWSITVKAGHTACTHILPDLSTADSAAAVIDAVDRVVWNRDGSAALLYSSSTNQLQRVLFAGAAPAADAALDLSALGKPAALALDPAGRQIAFAVPHAGIYLFAAGQSPALLAPMDQPAAIAFDGSGQRLYAVDLQQQQILAFDSGATGSVFASLAQPGAPAVNPVGLAVSGDGRYVLLADRAAQAVQVYDSASSTLTATIPLDFSPTRFEPLSSGPTILLNGDRADEWLLVLDARQLPGLFFVPANREDAQ
jgi:hypothetical protein